VGVWGGFPLRSNIPRSALCATLDTYNFYECFCGINMSFECWMPELTAQPKYCELSILKD
jgi:hypothetical protein